MYLNINLFQSSSSEREGLMKVEIERIEQRNRELTNQNKLLHEQMEKVKTRAELQSTHGLIVSVSHQTRGSFSVFYMLFSISTILYFIPKWLKIRPGNSRELANMTNPVWICTDCKLFDLWRLNCFYLVVVGKYWTGS